MTEIFEECEREYSELFVNTSTKYITASSLSHGEKKKREILELQAALDDADVLIQKMDLEARSLQPSLKAILLAKLREYKTDQNKLKREVEELALHNSNVPAHEELLESGMAGANSARKIIGSCSNCVYDRMNSSISMEVLKWLPVKSLIRFKGVSKEWASLINHGDFFNLHREFSNSRIERFSFLIERGTNAKNQSSEIFLFNPGKAPQLICEGKYFDPNQPRLQCVEGLVILEDLIFNPATGKKLDLPPLGIDTEHDTSFSCFFYFMGFSPSSSEYKILCATSILKLLPSASGSEKKTFYKIFTLGQSSWRSLKKPLPECLEFQNRLSRNLSHITYCCVKGVLYMYPYRTSSVIAFDLATEDSKLISFHKDYEISFKTELHEFKSKLVIFHRISKRFWILEDESSQRWREGVIDDQANWFGAFHFLYDITKFPEIKELLFGHDYHRLKYVETFFEPKLIEGTDQYEAVLEKDKADTKEWEVARDEQNKINAESDQYEAVLEKDKASTKEWEVARDEQNKINAESDQYEAVLEKDKDSTKEWEVARDEQNKINAEFDQCEAVLEKDNDGMKEGEKKC